MDEEQVFGSMHVSAGGFFTINSESAKAVSPFTDDGTDVCNVQTKYLLEIELGSSRLALLRTHNLPNQGLQGRLQGIFDEN